MNPRVPIFWHWTQRTNCSRWECRTKSHTCITFLKPASQSRLTVTALLQLLKLPLTSCLLRVSTILSAAIRCDLLISKMYSAETSGGSLRKMNGIHTSDKMLHMRINKKERINNIHNLHHRLL